MVLSCFVCVASGNWSWKVLNFKVTSVSCLLVIILYNSIISPWSLWYLGTTIFRGTWNFEPSCGICQLPRNLYVFTEFCGIRYWPVIQGSNVAYFDEVHHDIYHSDSGSDGRNIENIELSLSEILPVYLVDRMCLSVAVTGNKYCIFGRVEGL